MTLYDYGFTDDMIPEGKSGTPARIISVHKGRFGVVSEYSEGFARLKAREYYYESEDFPTVGDFVLMDYVEETTYEL